MVHVLAVVVGLCALVAWLSAAVHAMLLLGHRRDDLSLFALAFQGYRFYRADTWKPSGLPLHRRFVRSALAFALFAFLTVIAGVLG